MPKFRECFEYVGLALMTVKTSPFVRVKPIQDIFDSERGKKKRTMPLYTKVV